MVAQTMYCMQETPANALATNKDATQIVVAGRSVFKIYSIEEEEFVEKLNLRVGKNLNLNFSCADVVWNGVDDHILATAATNGAVVTWNLNKSSRSKQDIVFQDHKRTVNKVCFHEKEPNILISGSQDGTMKIFDLRKKEATSTFTSMSESVRDVQFSPFAYFQFAAVQENGNVQLWDWRRTDRCERQFTAHSGPVFACDWHPEEKNCLATAGRDKTIKVWDVVNKPVPDFVIQTIASVSRIKWRPSRKLQIASSSLVVDFSVNVWDVQRPYIPYASFTEHKDVTTGILWRKDPKILLSVSKDCSLYQHVFKDAYRPADHVNPVAMDLNSVGDIALATSDRILGEIVPSVQSNARPSVQSNSKIPFMFRRMQKKSDLFKIATSSFYVFQEKSEKQSSSQIFVKFAKNFQLSGRSKSELCDNNAMIANSLQCPEIATTWNILKIIYDKNAANITSDNNYWIDGDDANQLESAEDPGSRHHSGGNQGIRTANPKSRHHSGGGERLQGGADIQRQAIGDSTRISDEDAETDLEYEKLTNITSVFQNPSDFEYFGDPEMGNMNMLEYDYEKFKFDDPTPLLIRMMILPHEAFQPRHEIFDRSPPPELYNAATSLEGSEDEGENHGGDSNQSSADSQILKNVILPTVPNWNVNKVVVSMLEYYAKVGNVQMCVSVLIVFCDDLKDEIDENLQEQWFFSYIDLLQKFRLWTTSNEIIKLSRLPNVNSSNQQSTTVHTNCNNCNRFLNRVGWWCERCKKSTNTCSVCHEQVRGLYVWCQGCSHGGHLEHIKEWMSTHCWCPAGCGHYCEYT
ncbi:GATOR complex protein WDR24 [Nymphon striatum]|nr:GATOR complex protein WDR24 [Nymphon striatum]